MVDNIKEYIINEEIAKLYEIYEAGSLASKDQEELQSVLVQLSQDKMHEKVVEKEHFNWDKKDEQFVLRVLYELALAHYEQNMLYEAMCEFELLCVLSDNKEFSLAMKKHLFALDQELDYEDFVTSWLEGSEDLTFYMHDFDVDYEKQFVDHLAGIEKKLEKTAKIFF